MQQIPHDLMRPKQWLHIDTNAGNKIAYETFVPMRLRGGSDDPKHNLSLDVACDGSATKQLTDALFGPGGDVGGGDPDGDSVSIQSENRKADSLSDRKNDLNNNNDQNQEKDGTNDVTKQLEKWNKVRESLYSQYGWSSENVNQNSKWDVDMTTTPTEGCQNRDKSVITGTNQWSNEFTKGSSTEEAITFADLAQSDRWSNAERWATNDAEVDREEQQPAASYGGAIPRDYRVQADDAQLASGSQFASTFNQYRSQANANDWNKPFPSTSQNQNQNQNPFPRPITKKTTTPPLDGGPTLPHPNDQWTSAFTTHFQQMNLQDNIMHPYQQRFTAQSTAQPQNHHTQMSPFDFGQNDSFAQNGREQSQYPWHMPFERSTMMPSQNQSFFAMDSALAQNELHEAANSRWPMTELPTAGSGDASSLAEQFAMRSAIDLVDPSTSTNFIPTAATAAPTKPSTIPNWQHSSFYQNYW